VSNPILEDALAVRVVDGELDNAYLPSKTPITVSAR
jgi:hypothetical protein